MSVSTSSDTPWQRPRVTLPACLELSGRWWVILVCGLLLLTALLLSLQRTQAQALREARLEIALQGLRERLETSLSLGFELADSERAQALLEDLLADDPSLLAAEVFDASAISLFNTDRSAIGERVPPSWLMASSGSQADAAAGRPENQVHAWSVTSEDSFTLGLPIRGSFGEIAGQVSITSGLPPSPSPWPLITTALLALLALAASGLLLTIWLLRVLGRQQNAAEMNLAQIQLRAAETRMASALADLKRDEDLT